MALLQSSTATTANATTSATAQRILCSSTPGWQLWSGSMGIGAPPGTVDILQNNNGYAWILGWIEFIGYQSYNSYQSAYFSLSRYGYSQANGAGFDGWVTLSRVTGANADISILRGTASGGPYTGSLLMNVWIMPGNNVNAVTSSHLTRMT